MTRPFYELVFGMIGQVGKVYSHRITEGYVKDGELNGTPVQAAEGLQAPPRVALEALQRSAIKTMRQRLTFRGTGTDGADRELR